MTDSPSSSNGGNRDFRVWLRGLADEIERARAVGLPISFPRSAFPEHGQRLLESMGVELTDDSPDIRGA